MSSRLVPGRGVWARSLGFSACVLVLVGHATATAAQAQGTRVLSGRPDMVSGGNVLVEVTAPTGISLDRFAATLNGKDVARAFRPGRAAGLLIGRIDGLALGKNTIEVRMGGRGERLELINHPITGPVFSGPHQKPFICQTVEAGLGPALDADCGVKTVVTYLYKSNQPPQGKAGTGAAARQSPFRPYDPSRPRPADLAQTTTTENHTVSYIVRTETGTINRAIYRITFLHEPGRPLPDPWTSTPGWNGRLVYSFGGGCHAGYRQGSETGNTLDEAILSRGYAMASASLNVPGTNCDDVISAETVMMVKEHFIKQFGVPIHTIGVGNSGGAAQVQLIAQNYPGLLDGILPSSSFPDIASLVSAAADCWLLTHVFDTASQQWTDDQKAAVSGYATWGVCPGGIMWGFPDFIQPSACLPAFPKELVYNAASNPTGVRCSPYDNQVNVYGRDRRTGFARRPIDNVGVQYGLAALNAGTINAEQFLELNEKIGGFDVDGKIVTTRTVADPAALRLSYQTGRVNTGSGGLSAVPIIDWRRYLDPSGNIHDKVRSFSARARLLAANGRADNQVILVVPATMDSRSAEFEVDDTLGLMDKWLDNIAIDTSKDAGAVKAARNKPPELVDACWTPQGEKIVEPQTHSGPGRCNQLYPSHGDPRIAAGAPVANDILKCTLKPVDPKDYAQPMTAEQFARLKAIFPTGVCDFTRPGAEQRKTKATWIRY